MGQEIESTRFLAKDFQAFQARLVEEMRILRDWFSNGGFVNGDKVGGFELELWLTDSQGKPAPINDRYLRRTEAASLPVVAELAQFNVELNSEPRLLHGACFSQMRAELENNWRQCDELAAKENAALMMIGILPTVQESELVLANMSKVKRYRALNEQIFRLRNKMPVELDIDGRQALKILHNDVMLESATTSFQLHLQVTPENAARYYNAAHILSAPMVAISANSPYLFGHDLWDETRIPLFEQSVALASNFGDGGERLSRVTFGSSYVESSLYECFQRNQACYPVLLPVTLDDAPQTLPHLRLHNGTIWRWNRPLIGFDAKGAPHLRLEHRVVPAGPTAIDAIANAALFFGAIESMATQEPVAESRLDFETARRNFYAAAKHGLKAKVKWLNGKQGSVAELLRKEILPMARKGLESLDIDRDDIELYLDVIAGRLRRGKYNGAEWQRAYVDKHGHDMAALTQAYRERQQSGEPVYRWSL